MRIISGKARGMKLESLAGSETRPTLDSVKEAIFSMLFEKIIDARILDLFAGSGALGIEALSRGACDAVFVDKNPKALDVVRKNVIKARMEDNSSLVCSDFETWIKSVSDREHFDIIFLDPPYAAGLIGSVLNLIKENKLLSDNGIVVIEFDNGTDVDIHDFRKIKDKKYGRVCINILEA